MEHLELNVEERSALGSSRSRRMRKEGMVPAVVYGEGKDAQSVMLSGHEFLMTARGKMPGQVFKFKSRSTTLDGQLALVKDVQIEPLKERILHVDFMAVHEGQQIHVKVPVELTGENAAVKEGRGLLVQASYEIEVKCALKSIPSQLTLSIVGLEEGKSLHAADIELPEGAELYSNSDLVIVSVLSAKQVAEEQAAGTTPAQGQAAATPGKTS